MQVNMNSVERVQEYLEIEHESTEGQKPPAAWPSREGELVFEGVVARYDESLPPVLKDVSFTVRPRGAFALSAIYFRGSKSIVQRRSVFAVAPAAVRGERSCAVFASVS